MEFRINEVNKQIAKKEDELSKIPIGYQSRRAVVQQAIANLQAIAEVYKTQLETGTRIRPTDNATTS